MRSTASPTTVTLPTDKQILIEREFHATAPLVYRAFTEPELVRRWWHARRGEVTLVEIDLRAGGRWRHVMLTSQGTRVGFHGEYREIVPNERIVTTEAFEGHPDDPTAEDAETLNTVTLSEVGGRTKLAILIEASSQTRRDAIVASGMEDGLEDALDLLEQVAGSLNHLN
jgi:uncharacterized protein YndB with AHSA1/START domain